MKNITSGRSMSMPVGLAVGAILFVSMILAGSGILAKLVSAEIIREKNIGYGIMILLITASWVSTTKAYRKVKRKATLTAIASGVLYWGILLAVTALFFGGQYAALTETFLMILCGSLLACLSIHFRKGRGVHKKIKAYNR